MLHTLDAVAPPRHGVKNDGRIYWDDCDLARSLSHRFERIVRLYPHRLAVHTARRQLTYHELNQTANRIAHAILTDHGADNEPVAILIDEPSAMIAAIVGVLKAGKIYVPLDSANSEDAHRSILADCRPRCIVTNDETLTLVERVRSPNAGVINIDKLDESLATANLDLPLKPETVSSIIYTSGSTGEPKGVVEDHRYILRIVRAYSTDIDVTPDDRLILLFSLSSNGSLGNLFGALLNGASVHCPALKNGVLAQIAAWLRNEKITVYYSTASLFRNFVDTLQVGEIFPAVRIVQLSAEPVLPRDVQSGRRHFSPSCIFFNRYGATETGPFLQYKIDPTTPVAGDELPVGFPIKDMQVYVADDSGKEVPPNTTGQLVVRSRYLSIGYWNKPELSATKFLADPQGGRQRLFLTGDMGYRTTDGCFFLVGRKDFQVKIRGYRVDTAEVEKILLLHPGIKLAAVAGRKEKNGEMRLVAYYVARHGVPLTGAMLQSHVRKRLQDYMVPSVFIELSALPTTPGGKIDRRALAACETLGIECQRSFAAARTPVEEILSALWIEILGTEQVSIHDSFLELGGHSLSAAQIIARVRDLFGVELSFRSFLDGATVASLAEQIEQASPRDSLRI